MLSRVEDLRVFESSDDVILGSSSRQYLRQQQINGTTQQYLHQRIPDEQTEDEQLHPQHPYRMRKRVLQRKSEKRRPIGDPNSVSFRKQMNNRPMELVILSSGEIVAKEDCPPGLQLPKLPQELDASMTKKLGYHSDGCSSKDERDPSRQVTRSKRQVKVAKSRARQQPRRQQQTENVASTSSRFESVVSDNASVLLNDSKEGVAPNVVKETRQAERAGCQTYRKQSTPRDNARHETGQRRSGSRHNVHSALASPLKLDHLRLNQDDARSNHSSDKAYSASSCTDTIQDEKSSPSDATLRESRRHSSSFQQRAAVLPAEETPSVLPSPREQSLTMQVSHVEYNVSATKAKDCAPLHDREQVKALKGELQSEKEQRDEQRTELLDEKGKNELFRDRIDALEAQLVAKDSETRNKSQEKARAHEMQRQSQETQQSDRIHALEERIRSQEAQIARFKEKKDQLKAALEQQKNQAEISAAGQRLDRREPDGLETDRDDMARLLQQFLISVERWKDCSRKEMQTCDDPADLAAFFEHTWLDFPQFPNLSAKLSTNLHASTFEANEQSNVVKVLQQKLCQREDELRQTHIKYAELKELCARQCVREADLQNFINEHRLRGNLVIHKPIRQKPIRAENKLALPDRADKQQRSARLKMISSRGTNTSAQRKEDKDYDMIHEESSDNPESYDKENDAFSGRTPNVFVQVDRDCTYERASYTDAAVVPKLASSSRGKRSKHLTQPRIERIRFLSSSRPPQQYERDCTLAARKTKPPQQHVLPQSSSSSRLHSELLGECPPGCKSRRSFMRKKKSPAPRPKATKRPVAATSSRGAVGVVRPWM